MPYGVIVRKNQYYDSVFLMGVSKRISEQTGVEQSAVLMASDANKSVFAELGIQDPKIDEAKPNDLVVAVIAQTPVIASDVLGRIEEFLNSSISKKASSTLKTLQDGLSVKPSANLAVISVPGEYAAREARKAIEAGLHVFLFSDNVSLEEELEIKTLAAEQGLLVMGPDCGTSIIGGKGIGFANAVSQGAIGVVGPSGTGLQEFTSQVHNYGYGITHAIGTGSHDLSEMIGGITTRAALKALDQDPHTKVIAIVSKPPSMSTLALLSKDAHQFSKPVIACFLGIDPNNIPHETPFHLATTIDEAVNQSIELGYSQPEGLSQDSWHELLQRERATKTSAQRYIRGLFAGGTFCYQAQQILLSREIPVYSNAPLDRRYQLESPTICQEHTLIDMGDDYFTRGKPHPMIDGTQRRQRILVEGNDPSVSILFLDFVLGYNASPDPVGELIDAIRSVKQERNRSLTVVANICGTNEDPQDLSLQVRLLEEAGVIVFQSNALAARFCADLVCAE